jgi:hypothetical protein
MDEKIKNTYLSTGSLAVFGNRRNASSSKFDGRGI